MVRTSTNLSRGRVLDGPHKGRRLRGLGGKAPRRICLLDADWCYHEYELTAPLHGMHQYRYLRRLGRPHWANIAGDLVAKSLGSNGISAQNSRR